MLQNILGSRQRVVGYRTRNQVKTITPMELYRQLNSDHAPLVVDVRTVGEYEYDGHISGSRLLPLHTLRQRHNELPKDRPMVMVCRSGSRSHGACEQLAEMGYTDVTNLVGGMLAWQQAGLPTT
jgi:rhodanese-related sulfurtransferase